MTGPVLLCFDGSGEATEAIRGASALLAGRDVIVLSVAVPAKDELPLDPVSDLVGRVSGLYADWDKMCSELADRHARSGCRLAAEAGLNARPMTAAGKPAPTILRVADEQDAALIVLGSGAHGALGGLLGSVTAWVVHHSKRPVLVIPEHSDNMSEG